MIAALILIAAMTGGSAVWMAACNAERWSAGPGERV